MITVVGGLKVERLSLVLDLIEDHQYGGCKFHWNSLEQIFTEALNVARLQRQSDRVQ